MYHNALFVVFYATSVLLLSVIAFGHIIAATPTTNKCRPGLDQYDFIIIGGGTAGLALATRLSQRLSDCILVIEAGPDGRNVPGINVPGLRGSIFFTQYDWNLTTVPQSGLNNRRVPQIRGHVLGGSSALNLLTWDRGAKAEYDAWGKLGNPGWNWNSMYENMLEVDNFTDTEWYDSEGVGYGGPIQSITLRYNESFQDYYIPALKGLGIPENNNSLNGNLLGACNQPGNIRSSNWTRSYSASAYLPLAGTNLHLLVNTTVAKINLKKNPSKIEATGVTLSNGTVIKAKKEVILSAGTLLSPRLLELSGIGQKSVLSAAGIPPILDLPGVGENLQDHVRIQTAYQLKPEYQSGDVFKFNSTYAASEIASYNAGKTSRYDYTVSVYAFLTWSQIVGDNSALLSLAQKAVANSTKAADRKKNQQILSYLAQPELQIPALEFIASDGYTGQRGYPIANSSLYGQQFFTIIAGLMHPFSKGSVHLNTTNPNGPPVIDPRYLQSEYDVKALVEAAKFARTLARTPPLNQVWIDEYEPGFSLVPDGDDAKWTQYIRNASNTIYHGIGTCAMAPKSENGVVDASLRVHGIRNLRVVDASVMPSLVSGHIQTAVYGIAEKAADIIVQQWRN